MKKSLMALAMLGAFAGAAQAQSSVIIYGTVDAGMIKRTGQTLAIGKRANNTLGFKGTEDLGGGLKALFQAEIRYEPDTGTIESVVRPLFQGQTRVGISGEIGMVRLGRGLTAFQETATQFEPWHGLPNQVGFQTDLTVAGYTSDPLGVPGNSTNRFANALFYNSPEFGGGFQVNTTIGTREGNGSPAIIGKGTAAAPQFRAGADASANPFSISTTYKNGPAGVMLAYERNGIESKLWSIAGSIKPAQDLRLMASYTKQDQAHTKLINTKTKAWVVGANYTMGPGTFLAGYGQKNPDGVTKTKQFSLGYEYSLSKRTYVYADVSNKKGPTTPSSINHFALGVNHAF